MLESTKNFTPQWRKKQNPEDKDKTFPNEQKKYFNDFRTTQTFQTSFTSENRRPNIPLPHNIESPGTKMSKTSQSAIEKSKTIVLTESDFPSLKKIKKTKKKTLNKEPLPTETPNNTPNTICYLEIARKNADKPAPKLILTPKKYEPQLEEIVDNEDTQTNNYWVEDLENDFLS